ncbi:MAG: cysteine--tRNA ligase [Sandaracinaceae bacterium]|nr:cysteine--tRNA ligase [Sandaracinaceae bacterium]
MAAPFRLSNTLTRTVEDFRPREPGKVGLYVCGMTVYDDAHVGHARAMVTFDMVTRYLRHRGWDVTFVRNYTDVDDKIIDRALERGEDPLALANRYIASFEEDVANLGLLKPSYEPRVTQTIPEIQALIQRLIDRGCAYESEGSVWFAVQAFPEYGKLSGQKVEDMRQPEEPVPGKRSPQDFALWKAAKPGEPAWDSPWGPGRPGWHIECSAMAHKHLGEELDIHGGGLDLVFPHHENEIAQSECGHAHQPYARYWMHNGLLTMASGQKMGKSLGNVFNIKEALKLFPAEALRIYYMQVHYRSPLPWSIEALPDALGLLARLYEAKEVASQMQGDAPLEHMVKELGADAARVVEMSEAFGARFYAAMDDDFNTAKALGYAFELARAVNRLGNHKKSRAKGGPIAKKALAAFEVLADALGLLQMAPSAFIDEVKDKRLPALGLTREEVDAKLAARMAAREAKDWAKADAIRGELEGKGIAVMDRPGGVDWRIRLEVREEE